MLKKFLCVVCVSLVICLLFAYPCGALTLTTQDFYLRGDLESPQLDDSLALGVVTQYGTDGTVGTFEIYPRDDKVTLYEDRYGVYGFAWDGFDIAYSLTGKKDYGTYTLKIRLPWTDSDGDWYLGETDTSYRVNEYMMTCYCMLQYKDANGIYRDAWTINDVYAYASDAEGFIGETTDFVDEQSNGDLQIKVSEGYITRSFNELYLEIKWDGKPSSSNDPRIIFQLNRNPNLSHISVTPFKDYLVQQGESMKDKLQNVIDQMQIPPAEYDNNLDVNDFNVFNTYIDYTRRYWVFIISLASTGLSIAVMSYILHGERDM